MSKPVFYVPALPGAGGSVLLDGDEGFHAASVRRIRVGEAIVLGDGAGAVADCVVTEVNKKDLTALVEHPRFVPAPQPPVTVVQALPKSERSELAVELATEAGADAFVAWQAARCVARWDGPRADKGLRRWSAVARAAARQSRRAWVPPVEGVLGTTELAARIASSDALALVLHEESAVPLADLDPGAASAITLIVGPEGGIGADELATLTAAGARPVRLGPTVLRTSTAAAVALGALGVLTGRWDLRGQGR
ncbi:16S rRNA (uracil(1498)-N(3))-methyltransferase [Mycolicibacterium fallax]|uniref:Ribosomal RNA small subunit methyltransferase E n=1 Tax=Mycolicibacterium fallax TaxID=1793 RepID=A0A1X1QZ82_MYCFA|nr:16S rRNA (uracil(1498)-N(3))-methyltransferase [Mycolicibacterium fallax]ORU96686.1 rRNA methyltransferase [Mycolicibacterium fallax]BBY97972.1 ribosomal RNA small subunit methyltransferase E [Mycolicibacterium fallax]